jgi:hypothetical protein
MTKISLCHEYFSDVSGITSADVLETENCKTIGVLMLFFALSAIVRKIDSILSVGQF